jgi:hypothetical protein
MLLKCCHQNGLVTITHHQVKIMLSIKGMYGFHEWNDFTVLLQHNFYDYMSLNLQLTVHIQKLLKWLY